MKLLPTTLLFILILVAAISVDRTFAQSPKTHVAIVTSDDAPPIIVPRSEALELFEIYERHEVTHPEDIQLYSALQLALGAGGKKELVYAEGDETWAARKLREWQARGN